MASFEALVTKLLTDPDFAKAFLDKATRANALDSIGINSAHPGLLAALDQINYASISNVRQIMDPVAKILN
jgi:hypothetical protein